MNQPTPSEPGSTQTHHKGSKQAPQPSRSSRATAARVLLQRPSSMPENRRGKELGCKRFQCENSKCILLLIKRRPCLSRNNVKIKFQKLNAQHISLPTPSQHFRWLCPRSLHGTSKNKRVAKAVVSLIGLISSLQVLSTNLMLYPPSSLSRHAALCECTSSFSD